MSITHPDQNCQELITAVNESLRVLMATINDSRAVGSTVRLALLEPQLALLASWWDHNSVIKSINLNASPTKTREFLASLQAWQYLKDANQHWHLIDGELAEQEISGAVTTSLSTAIHFLLNEVPGHHYLVPMDFMKSELPAKAAYHNLTWTIHTGEKIGLQEAKRKLQQLGYIRQEKMPEPGNIRIRGEQIDVYHPIHTGFYTIILYGETIESIIHQNDRRSETVLSLKIPPVGFPEARCTMSQSLEHTALFCPSSFVPSPAQAVIVYDALTPQTLFPWQKGKEITQELEQQPVIICYENHDRIRHFLLDHTHQKVTLCPFTHLAKIPLHLASLRQIIISEASLFPQEIAVRPISYQRGLNLVADLTAGRAAVHTDHGIGIYEGLQSRTINEIDRDYLILRYAAGDVLSVPVEYAHKVTAYLGEGIPAVHRLGGTAWSTTRKQAQHDAAKFAQELLTTAQARSSRSREPIVIDPTIESQLAASFPYTLTLDQEQSWQAVSYDLQQDQPMDRLIVGDVGFGKTEIAIRAACHVALNGKQVAIVAPTTLLVQQHVDTFASRLHKFQLPIGVLSRFISPADQRKIRDQIRGGKLKIVIGTHALLSKSTHWQNLGLVVIDEEQRFGVRQKEHFKQLRAAVDLLSLSATPIPRTLSMALSGLKELSVISTPPAGRKSVESYVGTENDAIIKQAISRELGRNGQVYVVAPKVRGLASLTRRLQQLFPDHQIAQVHGQLPTHTLAHIMEQFDAGKIDVLVSSTIIENGLDVPNANTMIVLQATYFGLSELYQLRGRVGRRERQGYAYFLYHQFDLTSVQRARLTALTEATRLGSGWLLAQRDLEIRGAGNLLGAEQSGTVNAVGVQLYLDMVHDVLRENQETSLTHRDVEIQLPLAAIIPATYIADVSERTHYYQLLSRATTIAQLTSHQQELTTKYGPLPPETINFCLLLELQHVAAKASLTNITHQTISPVDENPYFRLVLTGKKLPEVVGKLHHMGNWQVRGNEITLDMAEITSLHIQQLISSL